MTPMKQISGFENVLGLTATNCSLPLRLPSNAPQESRASIGSGMRGGHCPRACKAALMKSP